MIEINTENLIIGWALLSFVVAQFIVPPAVALAKSVCSHYFKRKVSADFCWLCFSLVYAGVFILGVTHLIK